MARKVIGKTNVHKKVLTKTSSHRGEEEIEGQQVEVVDKVMGRVDHRQME